MSEHAINTWVDAANTPRERAFRQATHTVLAAIARHPLLRQAMYLKGGILLGVYYGSTRYTKDLDFSNPERYEAQWHTDIVKALRSTLPIVVEDLGYDLDCRLQRHRKDPKSADSTYVNLKMTMGYAKKGSKEHKRLMQNQCPTTLRIDYNFSEKIPYVDRLDVDSEHSMQMYGLMTVIAEKYRALLQQPGRNRVRRQDMYDLNYLIDGRDAFSTEQKRQILDTIVQKCADRDVQVSHESLQNPDIRQCAGREYSQLSAEIEGPLPEFDVSYDRVQSFFEQLPWHSKKSSSQ